jgi:hypothetical protein
VHTFTAAAGGQLTPSPVIYWQDLGVDRLTASAWYPGGYTFPTDQGAGLQAADFIFARPVEGLTPGNSETKKLEFRHMTAKVVVTIMKGAGYDGMEAGALKVFGYNAATAIDTTDTSTGAITGSGNAWLTPLKSDVYTILLLPRTYAEGDNFLYITLGEDKYDYQVPAGGSGSLNIEAGKQYNFTVTVNRSDVAVTSSITGWTSLDHDELDGNGITAEPVAVVPYDEGYRVGDFYPYPTHPALSYGMVYEVTEDGRKGRIFSLEELYSQWKMTRTDYTASDFSSSGKANTAKWKEIAGDDLAEFPVIQWLLNGISGRDKVDWYIPGHENGNDYFDFDYLDSEVMNMIKAINYNNLNTKLEAGGCPVFVYDRRYWSSRLNNESINNYPYQLYIGRFISYKSPIYLTGIEETPSPYARAVADFDITE